MLLAKAYVAEGNEERAMAELTAAVSQAPADLRSHRMLADLALKRGDLERAVAHLTRVTELDPADQESRAALDLLCERRAPGAGSAILRLLDDDTFATVTFGALCLQQGLPDEAAAVFLRIVRRDPSNVSAWRHLEEALGARRERRKG